MSLQDFDKVLEAVRAGQEVDLTHIPPPPLEIDAIAGSASPPKKPMLNVQAPVAVAAPAAAAASTSKPGEGEGFLADVPEPSKEGIIQLHSRYSYIAIH